MLTYAAAGDSLTAGVGAPPGSGLVPQYRALTSYYAGEYVESHNFGVSGATTGDILHMLRHNSSLRYFVSHADIITITAGGNDLIQAARRYARNQDPQIMQQALARCGAHYAELLGTIRGLKSKAASGYIIRAAGLYNPLPGQPQAASWVQSFNRHIAGLECGHFRVAQIYTSFVGRERELLSFDGLHPNAEGYRVIAEQMSKLGYRPLF